MSLSEDLQLRKAQAEAFCEEHLADCCRELLELSETGILINGKVRELARLLDFIETNHALGVAESMVKTRAMKALVKHSDGEQQ